MELNLSVGVFYLQAPLCYPWLLFGHDFTIGLPYRRESLTSQLEREKLFRFAHIAYAYVVKTELFFLFKQES